MCQKKRGQARMKSVNRLFLEVWPFAFLYRTDRDVIFLWTFMYIMMQVLAIHLQNRICHHTVCGMQPLSLSTVRVICATKESGYESISARQSSPSWMEHAHFPICSTLMFSHCSLILLWEGHENLIKNFFSKVFSVWKVFPLCLLKNCQQLCLKLHPAF